MQKERAVSRIHIQKLRKAALLTQKYAAELIGVEQGQISKWENSKNPPLPDKFAAIAKAYNCDIAEVEKAAQEIETRREQRRQAEIERRKADKERMEGAGQ